MKKILFSAALIGSLFPASAQSPVLVKDIYSGSGSSSPKNLLDVSGTLYFSATDATTGTELWKSNGTLATTSLVQDIYVGGNANPANLTNVNGILYFTATDAAHGTELWKTDGITTTLVSDISPSTASSYPHDLVAVGNTLYFVANDGTSGFELWKTDGINTQIVRDIYAGTNNGLANQNASSYLTQINGTLYFAATDGSTGTELWKSNGTAGGTSLVKDIYPNNGNSYPNKLINWNGTLYFWADNGSISYELWKSDGTSAGTVLIKDILSGGNGTTTSSSSEDWYSNLSYGTNELFPFNNVLYFVARDNTNVGWELYKTDGTSAGTVLVKDIYVGTQSSIIFNFKAFNNEVYFTATDGSASPFHGNELWKTDGTAGGTVLVKDIRTGINGSDPKFLTVLNGVLYFASTNGSTYTLWKTDGTDPGTFSIPGVTGVENLAVSNGALYFSGYDNSAHQELYKLDVTAAGIYEITESRVSIYPNPSQGIFNIESAGLKNPVTATVFNTVGQVMLTPTITAEKATLDLSALPPGMYFISLNTGNTVITRRIIKE